MSQVVSAGQKLAELEALRVAGRRTADDLQFLVDQRTPGTAAWRVKRRCQWTLAGLCGIIGFLLMVIAWLLPKST
jgi:hypothetical protein